MAYIEVNNRELSKTADEIFDYVNLLERNMEKMNEDVVNLSAGWKGKDYQQVKKEWNEIKSDESTYSKTRNELKKYANAIYESAKMYNDARTRAINRANTLCK